MMNKIRRKMKKKAMKTMKTTKTMMIPKTLMNLLTGREKTKSVKGRKVCVSCKQWVWTSSYCWYCTRWFRW